VRFELRPWMVSLGGTIAVLLIIGTGVGTGSILVSLATAVCLALGFLVGLAIGAEAGELHSRHQIAALTNQVALRGQALTAAIARATRAEEESERRLQQAEMSAGLAESHLARARAAEALLSGEAP